MRICTIITIGIFYIVTNKKQNGERNQYFLDLHIFVAKYMELHHNYKEKIILDMHLERHLHQWKSVDYNHKPNRCENIYYYYHCFPLNEYEYKNIIRYVDLDFCFVDNADEYQDLY